MERYLWVFYVWDEMSQKYEKYMEIPADEMDFSRFTIANNDDEPVAAESTVPLKERELKEGDSVFAEITSSTPVNSDANTGFNPYIAIIGGIAMISAVTGLIAASRKKKN